jgi:hypothetical protein
MAIPNFNNLLPNRIKDTHFSNLLTSIEIPCFLLSKTMKTNSSPLRSSSMQNSTSLPALFEKILGSMKV